MSPPDDRDPAAEASRPTWTKLGEVELHGGYRRVVERRFRVTAGEDDAGREVTFEIRTEPHGAAVVALTSDLQVVLVEEYRPGPELWLFELPGGIVDHGETAAQAAARELREETGHVATALVPLPSFWSSAYSTRRRNGFLAFGCTPEAGWEPEPGCRPHLVPIAAFVAHVLTGELTDGEAAMGALLALTESRPVQALAGPDVVSAVVTALAGAWPNR